MIAIKDMEMPEKCGSCDLFHVESPMHCTVVKGHKTVGAPYGMPRPEWCPLIEINTDGDTISRQAAIDAVSDACFELRGVFGRCEDALKALPSAQPERKTGRWIQGTVGLMVTEYKCSECGRTVRDDTGYDVYKDYPYCHCGAEMRKDGEE